MKSLCTSPRTGRIILWMGLLAACAYNQQMEINVILDSYDGKFAPQKAAAVWIQTPECDIVRTVALWSETFSCMLKNWGDVCEPDDSIDAVTSATIVDTNAAIKAVWDLKDYRGVLVPPGTYEFWVDFSEDEYWWQILDTAEEYQGYANWGTITIDGSEKTAYADSSIPYIGDFSAHYNPISSISVPQKTGKSPNCLSIRTIPGTRQIAIVLPSSLPRPAVLQICDLKGRTVCVIHRVQNRVLWDCTTNQGRKIPPGLYCIIARGARGNAISKAQPFMIIR